MKLNLRLMKDVTTTRGKVDVYVVEYRTIEKPSGTFYNVRGWATDNGEDVSVWGIQTTEFDALPVVTVEVLRAVFSYACEKGHQTRVLSGDDPGLCDKDVSGWTSDPGAYVRCDRELKRVAE